MKLNNYQPDVARKAIFRASIMAFIAGSTILTSCKKQNAAESEPVAVIQSTDKKVNSTNLVGEGGDGGYFYQNSAVGGTCIMTGGVGGGNFTVNWNNVNDAVCGKGWCTQANFYNGWPINTATSVPENRKVGYNLGSVTGDADFFGVYGWTLKTADTEPIEYYVIEKGAGFGGTGTTTITVDSHTYTVKTARRPVGAGTPFGSSTTGFNQYFDRWGGQTTGVNAQVDMGSHINNWKNTVFKKWGTMYSMILAVEGNTASTGTINATVWSNN